ncbi:hypothetical protein SNK05_013301 [Fusarium graminearum]
MDRLTAVPENYGASSPNPDFLPVCIMNHRLVKSDYTVRLTIEMGNGHRIILPEREVQAVYPKIVYDYWKALGGRCSATGFDMWHPFHILGRRVKRGGNQLEYRVQWVGYSKRETSWESGEDLTIWSPELKEDYDKSVWMQE